jgi:hypothetical protein
VTSQTKTKLKRWAKNSPIYLLMLVGLVAFIYFVLYRPLSIHQEKKNFEKAEASLNELYEKIVQKIGLPDQKKNNKSCGYASRAYGRGDRSCSIGIMILFKNKGSTESTQLMQTAAKLVNDSGLSLLGEPVDSFRPAGEYPGNQNIRQDYTKIAGLTCTVQYTYPISAKSNSSFTGLALENFSVELNCGGQAKAEHYPVSN